MLKLYWKFQFLVKTLTYNLDSDQMLTLKLFPLSYNLKFRKKFTSKMSDDIISVIRSC